MENGSTEIHIFAFLCENATLVEQADTKVLEAFAARRESSNLSGCTNTFSRRCNTPHFTE